MRTRTVGWALLALGTSALIFAETAGRRQGAASDRRPADGQAGERYYMVIYSAQERGKHPWSSHCFATFARVIPERAKSSGRRVELRHINWLSTRAHRSGVTDIVAPGGRPALPEPGENRTTADALELVWSGGRRVTRWGPYAIDRGFYEQASRHIDRLEGRLPGPKVLYKAIDLGYREGSEIRALNCIHAVSDIVRKPELLRTWTTHGDEAARQVVRHLLPSIKGPAVERPEVWPAIWDAIWRGAPNRMPDTIIRADIEPEPLAHAGQANDETAAAGANRRSR